MRLPPRINIPHPTNQPRQQGGFSYAEDRYAAGKSTVFEYSEAKTKYAQSLSEQAQAKYDFIFRTKILDFYNGTPITL